MAVRTGKEYIERLKENQPEVWFGGERVDDVTTHPYTQPAVETVAKLYDLQHDPEKREFMQYVEPETGEACGTQFLLPKGKDDLLKRRKFHQEWAEATYGWFGRSTDFMSAMMAAWNINADFFGDYADNVRNYFRYIRDNDLYLTHVLINPQVDRSKPASQQPDEFTYLGVVRETDEGLIVRGAKMLATAGAYSDEMLVWPFGRHVEDDAKYAIAFAIPMATEGVRLISRKSFRTGNRFDNPLSNQYDEIDSIVVFDDVLVPWERVFINQDVDRVNNIWKVNSNSLTGHQSSIRLQVKLEFLFGLTELALQTIQATKFPNVADKMGEISTYIELIRAAIIASEETADVDKNGFFTPNLKPIFAVRNSGNRWYPKVRHLIELLLGGGLMYQPADITAFASPYADDIAKYYRGADVDAEYKIRIFKAAADAILSEFGTRHELYEQFYTGDRYFHRIMTQYNLYDKSRMVGLAERFINEYDAESVLKEMGMEYKLDEQVA